MIFELSCEKINLKTMSKASKKNPLLEPFEVLIGEWKTVGKHPMFSGAHLEGKTIFEWLENGAFLKMSNHIDHSAFPDGIMIFGSDDGRNEYNMVYFDERGVSRIYACTIENNIWTWWRDDREFAQRFTCRISEDRNTIVSTGEMSRNGKPWEKDLELIYTRILQL
jgi:hypothetical protein